MQIHIKENELKALWTGKEEVKVFKITKAYDMHTYLKSKYSGKPLLPVISDHLRYHSPDFEEAYPNHSKWVDCTGWGHGWDNDICEYGMFLDKENNKQYSVTVLFWNHPDYITIED